MTSVIMRQGNERHELQIGRDSFTNHLQFLNIFIGLNGEHARHWKPRECSKGSISPLQHPLSLQSLECCLAGPRQLGLSRQLVAVGVIIGVGEGQELLESCDAGEPPGPLLGVRRPKSLLGVKPKRTASAKTGASHTRMHATAGLSSEPIETSWGPYTARCRGTTT